MEEIHTEELFQLIPTTTIDVEKNAKEDAFNKQPDSNATILGPTENRIVHDFRARLNQERTRAVALLNQLETERDRLSVAGVLEEAQTIPAQTDTDMHTELRTAHDDLVRLQITEQQAYSAMKIFMKENRLSRLADYQTSKVFAIAILAFIVVVESIGNAYFFATGSELGYLGGVLQAILVSAANVGIIAMGGSVAARYCHHISLGIRTAGWIGLGLFSMFTCAFNLLVAHYRVALQQVPETAITEATRRFVTYTFALANFDAWILFVLGIGAATVSGYKWYTMDDHYPGYGKVDRQYKQAQQDYSAARRRIDESVAALFKRADQRVADCVTRLEQVVQQYQTSLRRSQMIVEQYPIYRQHVQDVCNQVINSYRRVNQQIRPTPPPAYFTEQVRIDDPLGLPVRNLQTEDQRLNQLEALREEFLIKTRQEIGDRLRTIRAEADKQLQTYFNTILEEAKQRNKPQSEVRE